MLFSTLWGHEFFAPCCLENGATTLYDVGNASGIHFVNVVIDHSCIPLVMPKTSILWKSPVLTAALTQAFMPGASPPEVMIPIFVIFWTCLLLLLLLARIEGIQ